jgi:hypothetical protein
MPFRPWVVLATWLHVGAPQKNTNKMNLQSILTPKILSDQIWVASYFGQNLTYPYSTIFSSDFLYNSLKS